MDGQVCRLVFWALVGRYVSTLAYVRRSTVIGCLAGCSGLCPPPAYGPMLTALCLAPRLPIQILTVARFGDMSSDMILGALKLDYLPVPDRSLHGTMPFNPSQGLGNTESKMLRAVKALPFLGISVAAVYFMWGVSEARNDQVSQR